MKKLFVSIILFQITLSSFGFELTAELLAVDSPSWDSPRYPSQKVLDAGWTNAVWEEMRSRSGIRRLQLHAINQNQKVLDLIPPAIWTGGCVPTSWGMILMYWENMGYEIFTNNVGTDFIGNPTNYQLIASDRHISDFYYPEESGDEPSRTISSNWMPEVTVNTLRDLSEDPFYLARSTVLDTDYYFTQEDCLADIVHTSFSVVNNTAGGSKFYSPLYIEQFFERHCPDIDATSLPYFFDPSTAALIDQSITSLDGLWEVFKGEIDAGRPALFGVDSDGDGISDHAVVACGYEERDGKYYYCCYNTWVAEPMWYEFVPNVSIEKEFSIELMATLSVEKDNISFADFSPRILYKFYRPATGAYFFSANPYEVSYVQNSLKSEWKYQGPAFVVEQSGLGSNVPVFRFYNEKAAAHFYTASVAERDNVIATLSHTLNYEGVAFYAHASRHSKDLSVYRFFLPRTSSHYFTTSFWEKNYLMAYGDPSYIKYEGVAWYAANPTRIHY